MKKIIAKTILNYRKPVFWLALTVVAIVAAVGIWMLANPPEARHSYVPTAEGTLPEGISIQTEFPSYPIGSNQIKLIMQNETDNDLYYGSRYAVEKYDSGSGRWYQVPFADNIAFDALLNDLKAHQSGEVIIFLSGLKNEPSAGKYRVWFLDDRGSCEFELVSDGTAPSTTTTQKPNMAQGYQLAIEYILSHTIRGKEIKYLGIDPTNLVWFDPAEKGQLLEGLASMNLIAVYKSLDEVKADGGYNFFMDGVLLVMKNVISDGSFIGLDADYYKYGPYALTGLTNLQVTYINGHWQITNAPGFWIA
jgi:hypothetical protein